MEQNSIFTDRRKNADRRSPDNAGNQPDRRRRANDRRRSIAGDLAEAWWLQVNYATSYTAD